MLLENESDLEREREREKEREKYSGEGFVNRRNGKEKREELKEGRDAVWTVRYLGSE